MQPHLHRKMRRFLTEPDQSKISNEKQVKRLAIKEFKLNIAKRENINEFVVINPCEESSKGVKNLNGMAYTLKRNRQRHALLKLPGLTHQNNANHQKLQTIEQHHPVFKRSNPLYIVNSLFQIMKEDISQQNATLVHSNSLSHPRKEGRKVIQTMDSDKNQFSQFQVNSIRIHRGPRLLDNQINRLTQNSMHSRRKINSQGKSRDKYEQNGELVTFYNCKQSTNKNKFSKSQHNGNGYFLLK